MSVRLSPSILVIQPNRQIGYWLKSQLLPLGANIDLHWDDRQGLSKVYEQNWHLIILDSQLPNNDSLEICRNLRTRACYVPIIVIANEGNNLEGVLGLDSGADDYLCKPINPAELIARTKALLRRTGLNRFSGEPHATTIVHNELSVDKRNRELIIDGVSIPLTAREFDLIWLFANHPNRVFSRSELLNEVWGYNHDGYEQTVNSHINRLRNKLKTSRSPAKFLETVWGVGYRFRVA
jgi:DNA-binding response OmpR family regulator